MQISNPHPDGPRNFNFSGATIGRLFTQMGSSKLTVHVDATASGSAQGAIVGSYNTVMNNTINIGASLIRFCCVHLLSTA